MRAGHATCVWTLLNELFINNYGVQLQVFSSVPKLCKGGAVHSSVLSALPPPVPSIGQLAHVARKAVPPGINVPAPGPTIFPWRVGRIYDSSDGPQHCET